MMNLFLIFHVSIRYDCYLTFYISFPNNNCITNEMEYQPIEEIKTFVPVINKISMNN